MAHAYELLVCLQVIIRLRPQRINCLAPLYVRYKKIEMFREMPLPTTQQTNFADFLLRTPFVHSDKESCEHRVLMYLDLAI